MRETPLDITVSVFKNVAFLIYLEMTKTRRGMIDLKFGNTSLGADDLTDLPIGGEKRMRSKLLLGVL